MQFCVGANHSAEKCFKRIRKDKEKDCEDGDSDKQRAEFTHHKCFRCVSVDNLIAKCLKPPKDNEKQKNQVRFNERGNRAPQKEPKNGDHDNDQRVDASTS